MHTPRPWKDAGGWFVTAPEVGLVIAEVYCVGRSEEEAKANISVIAAALDLLDALVAMVDRWEPDTAGADRRMWRCYSFQTQAYRILGRVFRPTPGPLLRFRLGRLRGRRFARLWCGQNALKRAFVCLAHLLDAQLASGFDEACRLLGVVCSYVAQTLASTTETGLASHA